VVGNGQSRPFAQMIELNVDIVAQPKLEYIGYCFCFYRHPFQIIISKTCEVNNAEAR
jgi:hypothetical protein